uniref:tRNA synthetases class 1 n=1 Tax=Musca domestica TaxID=7370 RepID=T1P8T5_MUSDO
MQRIQSGVEIVKKKFQQQLKLLQDLRTAKEAAATNKNDEICDQMSRFVEATKRKHQSFENRLAQKLDEIQDEQNELSLNILNRKNCAPPNHVSSMTESSSTASLSEITEKLMHFEKHIQQLGVQQAKLQQQQTEQMNLITEIVEKLLQHTVKFEKFGKEVPTVVKEAVSSSKDVSRQHHAVLPIDFILGMTQKQNEIKK